MNALLDIVSDARELRDAAEHEFRKAVVRARERHSLRAVGKAAGLNFNTVRWIVRREAGEIDGYGVKREETKP